MVSLVVFKFAELNQCFLSKSSFSGVFTSIDPPKKLTLVSLQELFFSTDTVSDLGEI